MKFSDLWPRAAGTATSASSTEREPVLPKRQTLNGPRELPETLAECQVLEEELCRDAIRLECQIGLAEGAAKSEGRYSDPSWYHRAKAALKHLQRDRQRLMAHMKNLRIDDRRTDPAWNSYDRILVRLLADHVPREVMEECRELAHAQVDRLRMALEGGKAP